MSTLFPTNNSLEVAKIDKYSTLKGQFVSFCGGIKPAKDGQRDTLHNDLLQY